MRMTRLGLLALAMSEMACHHAAQPKRDVGAGPTIKDTAATVVVVRDSNVVAFFKDTASSNPFSSEGQTYRLQTPAERRALRAIISRQRSLWQSRKPRDYQFLLRVTCFCPGVRGWLLMEVRGGQLARAWDRTGVSVALADWNTFNIDSLYDTLERAVDNNPGVQISFDPRWHFPTHVSGSGAQPPDAWFTIDARAFRSL